MSTAVSNSQREIMLRFMSNNRSFAISEKGKITLSNQKKLWNILTMILNMELNGQINTMDSWMKTWNKWKSDIKIKMRDAKKNLEATGGGSPILIEYDYLDDQVITLLSNDKNCDLVLPKPKQWEVKALNQLMINENLIKKNSLTESKRNVNPTEQNKIKETRKCNKPDEVDEKINVLESEDEDVIVIEDDGSEKSLKLQVPNDKNQNNSDDLNLLKEFQLTYNQPSQSKKTPTALKRSLNKDGKRYLTTQNFTEYQRCVIALKQKKLKLMSETLEYKKKKDKLQLNILNKINDNFHKK